MSSAKTLVKFSIIASMAFLPLAHLKLLILGIPVYSVELPIIVALLFYLYGWKRGEFALGCTINLNRTFAASITFFFLGALFSFMANPVSWTGLGMIKTWFVLPILAVWLWLKSAPDDTDFKRLLFIWLAANVFTALVSLVFFEQGILTYDGRLAAWYASPNYLAFFLAPGVLVASYFISSLSFLRQGLLIVFWLALAILIGAIFFTGSYATWGSVFIALAIYFYLGYARSVARRQKIIFALTLIVLFVTLIFFASGSEKWQSLMTLSERSSLASRIMIWRSAVRIISDQPLWGIGMGRFQEIYLAYQKYFPPYLEWAVPQPHNLYLAVWLQSGLLGLAGFVVLISVWLRKMLRLWHLSVQDAYTRKTSAFLVALMVLFLLLGVADTPFFKTDSAFIFWLTTALGIGFLNHHEIEKKTF